MLRRLADARAVGDAPGRDLDTISDARATKADLAPVPLSRRDERGFGGPSARSASFGDQAPLHVGNLSQDRQNDLANASADRTKAMDIDYQRHGR